MLPFGKKEDLEQLKTPHKTPFRNLKLLATVALTQEITMIHSLPGPPKGNTDMIKGVVLVDPETNIAALSSITRKAALAPDFPQQPEGPSTYNAEEIFWAIKNGFSRDPQAGYPGIINICYLRMLHNGTHERRGVLAILVSQLVMI